MKTRRFNFLVSLLLLVLCGGNGYAEEYPLLFNGQSMEIVTIDNPEFVPVTIGEITPEDGGEAVFGILVPRATVVRDEDTAGVIALTPEGGLLRREVVPGVENAEQMEVIEGVFPGDKVLLTDAAKIHQRYVELAELYANPRESPLVTYENQLVYRRFFIYTGFTLAIAIPTIIWLRARARRGKLTEGNSGGTATG